VFICFERCTVDSDCELSSWCTQVTRTDGLVDYICIPQ
jgi:hypothetical protein